MVDKQRYYDPFLFPGEEKAKDEQKRKIELAASQRRADLEAVLATPEGRRLIASYIDRCGTMQSTFTGNSNGYFLEGTRAVGILMMKDINSVDPHIWADMIARANKKKEGA